MFGKNDKPIICTQIQERNPDDMIRVIKSAIERGTDAVGVQLEALNPEYKTEENIKRIMQSAQGVGIYVTNYMVERAPETYEQQEKTLLCAAENGADLIDIPGHMFTNEEYQLTFNESALKKQKDLIERIHKLGKKVLISTHIMKYVSREEIFNVALEQQSRGADVVKIVVACDNDKELIDNLETTRLLKEKLDVPFLLLSTGETGRFHRNAGPFIGCVMWLCAPKYGETDTKIQPLLDNIKRLKDTFYE